MMQLNQGLLPKARKEESGMIRNTIVIRHEHLEFLLCSLKQRLCVALQCPEKMRVRSQRYPAC